MNAFRNRPIRLKLLIIVLATLVVSLLMSTAAIAFLNHRVATNEFLDQLQVLGDITSKRSQAALAFKDQRTVANNLETLSRLESIEKACVFDREGLLFASYLRKGYAFDCPVDRQFALSHLDHDNDVRIQTVIELNKRPIGELFIFATTEGLENRLWLFIHYSSGVMLLSIIVASLLSARLQRALTLPIIKLSQLSELISKTHDFSLRARVYNHDETGSLAESFNGLINNIQDSQLQMQELVLELQEKTQQLESHTELVEDRNKVIRNMFAGAAHDLKQPLQAMSLFINALRGEARGSAQLELVQKLELSTQNMRSLFDDLLDVSKLESRLEQVEHGPVELKPLLDNVFQEFDALALDKNLRLRFHARDFVVDSNARMLERIIRNLLSNAIRYTQQGGVLLACRKRGDGVSIEIWDSGLGIPEDSKDKIFKRFYQVEGHTKESTQGYGLGLSIVKRLSELLHHPIEIFSRYGQGTMFRIRVPLYHDEAMKPARANTPHDAALAPEAPQPALANAAPLNVLPGEDIRVLLIDDDDLVRDGLSTLMTSWRMQVESYASIASMAARLESEDGADFTIIVSDFQLSDTETGFDAIQRARELLGNDVPALIVTGTTDPELLQAIKESGIRMLKKPVKAAKLRALINHLINTPA